MTLGTGARLYWSSNVRAPTGSPGRARTWDPRKNSPPFEEKITIAIAVAMALIDRRGAARRRVDEIPEVTSQASNHQSTSSAIAVHAIAPPPRRCSPRSMNRSVFAKVGCPGCRSWCASGRRQTSCAPLHAHRGRNAHGGSGSTSRPAGSLRVSGIASSW